MDTPNESFDWERFIQGMKIMARPIDLFAKVESEANVCLHECITYTESIILVKERL
ncbi:MAG: hypothetical protein VX777_03975 [Chlamydiota bacterium]|nr:hypothetical protein [Chlamydiota bacterium]